MFLKWNQDLRRTLALSPTFISPTARKDNVAKSTIIEKLAHELSRNFQDDNMSAFQLHSAIQTRFKATLTRAAEEALSEIHCLRWTGSMEGQFQKFDDLVYMIKNGLNINFPDAELIRILSRSLSTNYTSSILTWGSLSFEEFQARDCNSNSNNFNNNRSRPNNTNQTNKGGNLFCKFHGPGYHTSEECKSK